ncbi:MAG: hypothetical protein WDO71_05080 [Bacteroidota bacterium]
MNSYHPSCTLKLLFTFFMILNMIACTNQSNNKKETTAATETIPSPAMELVFDKLRGTWQSEDGKSFERWAKNDDGTFRSVAFSIKGSDTSWNEQALIYPGKNNWVFENTVKGQNEGKAVKFISTLLTATSVQFSNPAHDFPTDINYTVPGANTLNAFIIGPNAKGGKDTIPFNYTRVK